MGPSNVRERVHTSKLSMYIHLCMCSYLYTMSRHLFILRSTFLESNPHPSPPFTTQTFCITYNVITIMFFVLLIRNGHLEVVQFLVNGSHTDPNAVNKDGKTAVHVAAE